MIIDTVKYTYVWIKNEILEEVIAKRLLTYNSMRIVFYILLENWGKANNNPARRKKWTDPVSISQIAREIEMDRETCSRTLARLRRQNVIFVRKRGFLKQYRFNEHYREYKNRGIISVPKWLRSAILQRDNYTCQYCLKSQSTEDIQLQVDHVISVNNSGTNKPDNLITACSQCNRNKGNQIVSISDPMKRQLQIDILQFLPKKYHDKVKKL